MVPLNQSFKAFADRQIEFAELTSAVVKVAETNPSKSSAMMLILGDARDSNTLDEQQYQDLVEQVIGTDTPVVMNTTIDNLKRSQTNTFSGGPESDDAPKAGEGRVVKGRFELCNVIGKGGMGVVYKAIDRIKANAMERNPYVAVKVLNEDFKGHPESFIALQRECSRTQKLAHPNIATVYDFDHTGEFAYLTMELLEGEPLDKFIRDDLPENGLSFTEAWPIIEALGQALAFAHQRSVIHSDFKPGNAFITNSGEVKVLDFGIARAFKKLGNAETTTMFDPAKFGAFTPRYASCEMLEGEPPDPRDDIYGLAVVAYELLSTKHPYDGKAANMAKALKLEPAPVKSVTKAQNRTLKRALAFEREARIATVEEFLNELQGELSSEFKLKRQSRLLAIFSVGFVVLTSCVLFLLRN